MPPLLPLTIDPLDSEKASQATFVELLLAYFRLMPGYYFRQAGLHEEDEGPVSDASFEDLEVSREALQWLLFQGHVDHFLRNPDTHSEPWLPNLSAVVGADSGFTLTDLGDAFGGGLLGLMIACDSEVELCQAREQLRVGRLTPRYHRNGRALVWGRHHIKAFLQPAGNQELILLAAEELRWPEWLDDPLPRAKAKAKVRLHDAIKFLNRSQKAPLVRFRGDGTGTRFGWVLS